MPDLQVYLTTEEFQIFNSLPKDEQRKLKYKFKELIRKCKRS